MRKVAKVEMIFLYQSGEMVGDGGTDSMLQFGR
jgi:hypothetical protein